MICRAAKMGKRRRFSQLILFNLGTAPDKKLQNLIPFKNIKIYVFKKLLLLILKTFWYLVQNFGRKGILPDEYPE